MSDGLGSLRDACREAFFNAARNIFDHRRLAVKSAAFDAFWAANSARLALLASRCEQCSGYHAASSSCDDARRGHERADREWQERFVSDRVVRLRGDRVTLARGRAQQEHERAPGRRRGRPLVAVPDGRLPAAPDLRRGSSEMLHVRARVRGDLVRLMSQIPTSALVRLVARGASSPETQAEAERELDRRVPVGPAPTPSWIPGWIP